MPGMSIDLAKQVAPFECVTWRLVEGRYFIAWRLGSGGNTELLHIRADEPRRGYGTEAIRVMLAELVRDPPYESVFGFCRDLSELEAFYRAMGFEIARIPGIYKDGRCCLFYQQFSRLRENHGV